MRFHEHRNENSSCQLGDRIATGWMETNCWCVECRRFHWKITQHSTLMFSVQIAMFLRFVVKHSAALEVCRVEQWKRLPAPLRFSRVNLKVANVFSTRKIRKLVLGFRMSEEARP